MAEALGKHPQLIAWQIDNNVGAHSMQPSFNEETRRDWHAWLKAKYETIDRLNDLMGTRFWGQTVRDWSHVPMPRLAPAPHNPALMLDWRRFCSDTIVAFVRMQAETPARNHAPRPGHHQYPRLRPAGRSVRRRRGPGFRLPQQQRHHQIQIGRERLRSRFAPLRSRRPGSKRPPATTGFWVIEQKAGHVNWQDVNSLVRPGVVRLFTYQTISRGANGVLYFFWRQPRIGQEKFYGGVLTHDGRGENRIYKEISQIGQEIKRLGPALEGTEVKRRCLHSLHPRQRLDPRPAAPAQQVLLPARTRPALLHRAA